MLIFFVVSRLVDCITNPTAYESSQGSTDDIRIEAAHVISSLSYGTHHFDHRFRSTHTTTGSNDALKGLLNASAHQTLIYALSSLQPTDRPALKAAFARALKALTSAIADAVGPSQMGIHDFPEDIQDEARNALDYLFEVMSALFVTFRRVTYA